MLLFTFALPSDPRLSFELRYCYYFNNYILSLFAYLRSRIFLSFNSVFSLIIYQRTIFLQGVWDCFTNSAS